MHRSSWWPECPKAMLSVQSQTSGLCPRVLPTGYYVSAPCRTLCCLHVITSRTLAVCSMYSHSLGVHQQHCTFSPLTSSGR